MVRPRGPSYLLAWLILAGSAPAQSSSLSDIAACEALLSPSPDGEEAARCLYYLGKGHGPSREAAARRLEELQAERPDDPWFLHYLASLRLVSRRPGAEALYRRSIELSSRHGLPKPEVLALAGLSRLLSDEGRLNEAAKVVERAVRLAEGSGDAFVRVKAALLQSSQWTSEGEYERAYVLLRKSEDAVRKDGSWTLVNQYLHALITASQQTGRFPEARASLRRLIERSVAEGDLATEANARYGLASTLLDELREEPAAGGRETLLDLASRALDTARAAQRPDLEPQALWILGSVADSPEARGYLERCLEITESLQEQSFCRAALARRLAASDPAAAREEIQEALALAQKAGDVLTLTNAWHERMRVSWAIAPPVEALEDALAGLGAIEALRDKQKGSAGQPGLFSTWAEDYYWLSGNLLGKGDLDRAFGVIERMRSRTLIDALRLARPAPSGRPPVFASLERVRRTLGRDEALLSFQVAPWRDLAGDFGGGSWLLVATREATRAYRLADRTELRPAVSVFTGMFAARNGSETETAAVLHRKLLSAALADLPESIQRLVIVPDDALHRLPFAALRPEPDAGPLSARYEISLVPSATLWLGWRESRQAESVMARAVPLVFADPDSPDLSSGALPYSREEGKSVVHHLGGGELRLGGKASEAYLKNGVLGGFGLLHFATHARMYDVEPDRSCVLLAPGSPQEDGSLQVQEIARLALPGRTVVLSSCESAAGGILRGEGVMGLARAFFQAGAHTVVASLWPLRDDDGAALFDRFYRHLAEGMTISAALRAAQQDRIDAGAPAEAWAGVLVLGDGDRVPLPGGRKRYGMWVWVVVGVLVVTALLAAAIAGRRSRRSSRSAG